MADLSRHDRGQLVLVTAVTIAALLILVAALLSSVVYTENVATRGSTTDDARAAQLYRVAAVEAVDGLTQRANRGGRTYDEFRGDVATWNELQARHAATDGASGQVSVRSTTNGTRIYQTGGTRAFTSATDATSWELVSGATTVDNWSLTVDPASLAEAPTVVNASNLVDAGAFHVNVTDGTAQWRAFVYQDGGTVKVRVDHGGGLSSECPVPTDDTGTATIRFTPDQPCDQPSVEDAMTTPFAISYDGGSSATGNYSLIVDRPIGVVDDGDFASGDGMPSLEPHVSDVHIDVRYTTADLQYVVRNVSVDAEVES